MKKEFLKGLGGKHNEGLPLCETYIILMSSETLAEQLQSNIVQK